MTIHQVFLNTSSNMSSVEDDSVDLIVTSPPYPMIEMWDPMFFQQNEIIQKHFESQEFSLAF